MKKKAKTSRNHHFIPQCYLRGFVRNPNGDSKIHVIDFEDRIAFKSIPRNIGSKRDFNRIELESHSPDALEASLALFEDKLAIVLRRIQEKSSIWDRDDFAYLMNFIALLILRNPKRREKIRKFQENVARSIMNLAVSTPEIWYSSINSAKKGGFLEESYNLSWEDAKKSWENGEYGIEIPNMRQIVIELKTIEALLPHLFGRKWLFIKSENNVGDFMTSDNPVSLIWGNSIEQRSHHPPGLGLKGTHLFFPLSYNLAVLGKFEGADGNFSAGPRNVATINGLTVHFAQRQIYCSHPDFKYLKGDGSYLFSGNDILKDLFS